MPFLYAKRVLNINIIITDWSEMYNTELIISLKLVKLNNMLSI